MAGACGGGTWPDLGTWKVRDQWLPTKGPLPLDSFFLYVMTIGRVVSER